MIGPAPIRAPDAPTIDLLDENGPIVHRAGAVYLSHGPTRETCAPVNVGSIRLKAAHCF
jgi:hypothetical protein